ncbi:uncharacterized protein MYCGRDRAFT_89647 [Zymoseptoria tritici IPO323]|uniref:Uncharacterized protein n=1 Tax=Zymoseptoria tritici (strain CBS 115943 / IPO323) TaxID=336722 RepID=F9X093_ZYMTI|nr:uncharacterized protein MYCGRDRAFT_89647 [Zymoseptoria tritici IPO323]EGP92200.1 hypothetical protein MYCGRDRAFT_89647 [Zymoseptoria tritici IPO323]
MKGLFAVLAAAAVGPAFVSAQSRTHCVCQKGPQSPNAGPLHANNDATEAACKKWGGEAFTEHFPPYTQDDTTELCTDNSCIDQPTFVRYCRLYGAYGPPNCWGSDCNPN